MHTKCPIPIKKTKQSFQPTVITRAGAEPPTVPKGATAFYAASIAAGDVLTDNTLLVTKDTDPEALGKAIIARVSTAGHTVLECLGSAAAARALQGVVAARRGLLVRYQDVACVVASTYVQQQPQAAQASQQQQGGKEEQRQQGADGEQQQRRQSSDGAAAATAGDADAGSGGGGRGGAQRQKQQQGKQGQQQQGQEQQQQGPRRVLANRFVVLECAPRDPSVLRVRSTYGKAG